MKRRVKRSVSAFLEKAQDSENMPADILKPNCSSSKNKRSSAKDSLKCSDWVSLTKNNAMEEDDMEEIGNLSSTPSLDSSDEGLKVIKRKSTDECLFKMGHKEIKRRRKKKEMYLNSFEGRPECEEEECVISDDDTNDLSLNPTPLTIRRRSHRRTNTKTPSTSIFNTNMSSVIDTDTPSIIDDSSNSESSNQQVMNKEEIIHSSRASEWVKQLCSPLGPESSTTSWKMAINQSSSKKRPSYRKAIRPSYEPGGLAERMHKLIERQKSSLSFWSHGCSRVEGSTEDCSSVTVQIVKAVFVHSLLLTEAIVLSVHPPMSTDSSCSSSPTSTENNWQTLLTNGELVTVYFSLECAERLPINIDAIIEITSPWQHFIISEDGRGSHQKVVLMSTHYSTLVKPGVQAPARVTPRKPVVPSTAKVSSPVSQPVSATVCNKKLFENTPDIKSFTKLGALVDCFDVSTYASLSLVITVRAMYRCTNGHGGGTRWILLVEDEYRLFIEIIIKEEHTHAWQDVINYGLKEQFEVYNLQFIKRIDKGRKPKLSGLIEALSTARSYDSVKKPFYCKSTFCSFVLQTQDNSYWNRKQMVNPIQAAHVDPVRYSRVTCTAKIIHCSYDQEFYSTLDYSNSEDSQEHFLYVVLYISDTVNSTPYFGKIRLLEGSVSVPLSSPGVIVTITNALICNDLKSREELTTEAIQRVLLCMDQYSLMIPQEPVSDIDDEMSVWPVMSIPSLHISLLNSYNWWCHVTTLSVDSLIINNLVFIKGTVTSVDEDNAFIWLTCSGCGYSLENSPSTQCSNERYMYVCGGCGQSTCDPRICVQVTIIIANPEVHHHSWTVAVELAQETVMAFLPVSPCCVTMGLDVNPLINKLIALNVCLVTNITKKTDSILIHLKEIFIGKQA